MGRDLACSKWTLSRLGTMTNKIQVRGQTDQETYRKGTQYCMHECTMADYVRDLVNDHPRSKSRYLAALNIKRALREIAEEEHIAPFVASHKIHAGPFLWLARQGHYEYTHFDPDEGCLMIIEGQKRVRLFDSADVMKMAPNAKGSSGRTVQSSIDLEERKDELDITNHYSTLDEGDVLYIPAFWWHQVSALSHGVSVNIFWGEKGACNFTQKVISMEPFHYWLTNIIEQNRRYDGSFNRTLARIDEAVVNFLRKQWHEELERDQVSCIVKTIMAHLKIDKLPPIEPNPPKNPRMLKIRGLRDRGQEKPEKSEDEKAKKAEKEARKAAKRKASEQFLKAKEKKLN